MNRAGAAGAAPPVALDALLPHAGASRLIERVLTFDGERIVCEGRPPADPDHPLRLDGVLPAAIAVEYGAQAMAIHGALADPARRSPRVGWLVAVRELRFGVERLDAIDVPLRVEAERVLALGDQVAYRFEVRAGDEVLAAGRAGVALQPSAGSDGAH